MNKKIVSLIAAGAFIMTALSAQHAVVENEVPFGGWRQAETEHFNFIFEDASRDITNQYALYADDAWNKVAKIYSIPQDKTTIYVTARTNTVNAFTFTLPLEIMMFTTPYIGADFGFRDNWQKLFFTHELVHSANMHFEDKPYIEQKLFGEVARSFDLMTVPGWALEGLTTVLETELSQGGRGRSPYFEMQYKAPTLDNAFISYDDIGKEEEPPRGQSYVMGYLIMRSIADRWGIQALADIERNRSLTVSWEDSVRLVTGETPENIYREVRIALAKKYAGERSISEGIIISPNSVNSYYFKPALVCDDGTLITIRKSPGAGAAVVRLNPSAKYGSALLLQTKPQEDLNTVMKETILFTGNFSDADAVTASSDGTVYASLAVSRSDRMPGSELMNALFKWTAADGLKQLTKKVSVYQPSVSRDGKVLVAVQQRGIKMTIAAVDVQSGTVTPLLQDESLDYVQPAVNADGTKVAFLVLDGDRAKVAYAELTHDADGTLCVDKTKLQVVANGDGAIVDPSYPSWNSDGSLTYACNTRGRLEVFAVSGTDGTFVSKPVVSDPIGATWAYRTDRGVYYSSYASTGNVIKIKPAAEWGVVPQTNGPSMPGDIMHFGSLENDFPDYQPYDIPSEREVPKQTAEQQLTERREAKKNNTPVAVRGKTVAHRSEENATRAQSLSSSQTVLQNERAYIPLPKPVGYVPYYDVVTSGKENETKNYGLVYEMIFFTPKLQFNFGLLDIRASYYPNLQNMQGAVEYYAPVGPAGVVLTLKRQLGNSKFTDGTYHFEEYNSFVAAGEIPFINRSQNNDSMYFGLIGAGKYDLFRVSDDVFAINAAIAYKQCGTFNGGFVFERTTEVRQNSVFGLRLNANGLGFCEDSQLRWGGEGGVMISGGTPTFKTVIKVNGRYADFPSNTTLSQSGTTFTGRLINCEYPGRTVGHLEVVRSRAVMNLLDWGTFAETLVSFGRNTVDCTTPESGLPYNITFDPQIHLGSGLSYSLSQDSIEVGLMTDYDYETATFADVSCYVVLRMYGLSF